MGNHQLMKQWSRSYHHLSDILVDKRKIRKLNVKNSYEMTDHTSCITMFLLIYDYVINKAARTLKRSDNERFQKKIKHKDD